MKLTVLASGSGGNASLLEIGDKTLLIDAGISYRQLITRLREVGKELVALDYVFLTHEHSDHIVGLLTIQNKFRPRIYLTKGTYVNLPIRIKDNLDKTLLNFVSYKQMLAFSGFSVLPFMSFHDALEPCGYRFNEQDKSFVYLTDTGYFPDQGFPEIKNADLYMLESNHEPELLLESDRPWLLKKRILDDQGHLSNEDSAYLVTNILGDKTKTIVLAHLSEECNTIDTALETYRKVFDERGIDYHKYTIICAYQDQPLTEILI
ncbi:MAG: MBL fold metallo-hydrolase [Candidatus Izemoplasmatales bacterium]|jgi:phosphoribosyl 1,2-cyclic phosphodiesterase|nr:MBL fold metallo-hydrolase [Candidatus Izemoplasmatales bacterium]